MSFHPDSISQGEIHALKEAAEMAWGDDTRHPSLRHHPNPKLGQCYVTAAWLAHRLGGFIGKEDGHFFWVSPDEKYVLDISTDKHPYPLYKSVDHDLFKHIQLSHPRLNDRIKTFIDRADTIFAHLGEFRKVSLDYMGDAYPAEEPEKAILLGDHDIPPENEDHDFIFAHGHLNLSTIGQSLQELAEQVGLNEDHAGPMAVGHVQVRDGVAKWQARGNLGESALSEVLGPFSQRRGWVFGGLNPPEDENQSYLGRFSFVWDGQELLVSQLDWSKTFLRREDEEIPRNDSIIAYGSFFQKNFSSNNSLSKHPRYKTPANQGVLGSLFGSTAESENPASKNFSILSWAADAYTPHIRQLARSYEQIPSLDPKAVPAWQELAQDSKMRADKLRNQLAIHETDDPEPYGTPEEMFKDIDRGKFSVSRANSEHPVWTPDQNVDFRIAHDVLGHYPTKGDFGWNGENQACAAHSELLSPQAQQALRTECLAQTGYAIDRGGFGEQKVGFVPETFQPQTFASVPKGGFCHRHIRHGIYRLHTASVYVPPRLAKEASEALWEFCEDQGLQIMGANNNVIKRVEDLQEGNLYDPNGQMDDTPFFPQEGFEENDVFKCPQCGQLEADWHHYIFHLQSHNDDDVQDGHFPELDKDAPITPHETERHPQGVGEMTYSGSVLGGMTLPQEQRQWETINYGQDDGGDWKPWLRPQGETVHEWPDNWSIKRHNTPESMNAVGSMMKNCWQADPGPEYREWIDRLQNRGAVPHSLHDEHGIPRAAFFAGTPFSNGAPPSIHQDLGRNNLPLSDEHIGYLSDWANQNGIKYNKVPLSQQDYTSHTSHTKWSAEDQVSPIPFLYDIKNDHIVVGQEGQATDEIPGQFTPGEIVLGYYMPGAEMHIVSQTGVSYSIQHLVELWNTQYPDLALKSVYLQNGEENTKIASHNQ